LSAVSLFLTTTLVIFFYLETFDAYNIT